MTDVAHCSCGPRSPSSNLRVPDRQASGGSASNDLARCREGHTTPMAVCIPKGQKQKKPLGVPNAHRVLLKADRYYATTIRD